jgi:hypothetical protein
VSQIFAIKKRGVGVGAMLLPHRHADGCFVVSKTRFAKDYVRVPQEDDLWSWVERGYSVRMSNPAVVGCASPSLIAPASIEKR